MFQKIFGVFLVIAGALLVIKSEWFLQNFGRIAWAEKNLGAEGGTRLFYKLLGLLFIVVGMILILGFFKPLILWIFSPLMPK